MEKVTGDLNLLWGETLIEELVASGVDHFCISPGSRSTPLVMGAARNTFAKTLVAYDERGAAFYALGYGQAHHSPSAVITTSGSAVANCLPAVVEADRARIPLIILTADRPPELQNTSANQTMEQQGIFASYVRIQIQLPCPTEEISLNYLRTTINQAVYRSRSFPGPIHINCMFREPLHPKVTKTRTAFTRRPHTEYLTPVKTPNDYALKKLANEMKDCKKILIVVGKTRSKNHFSIIQLASCLESSIWPDITSGLRLYSAPSIVEYYDLLLLSEDAQKNLRFDLIFHLGDQITSKRYLQFIASQTEAKYIQVCEHSERIDPNHIVSQRWECNIDLFCKALTKELMGVNFPRDNTLFTWRSLVHKKINQQFSATVTLQEPMIADLVVEYIMPKSCLFLASSMTVRYFDMYAPTTEKDLLVGANRGVSGIDGTIASALGFARGSGRDLTLVIGDLAFLHDLNSLSLVANSQINVQIIVINNHGGGIFSHLPVVEHKEIFEPFFGTPHSFSFEHAANLFRFSYRLCKEKEEFAMAYHNAQKQKRNTIIEVVTHREKEKQYQQKLQQVIAEIWQELH